MGGWLEALEARESKINAIYCGLWLALLWGRKACACRRGARANGEAQPQGAAAGTTWPLLHDTSEEESDGEDSSSSSQVVSAAVVQG